MDRKLIACLIALLSTGCAHLRDIPPPANSWTYVEADENTADMMLSLSLSKDDVGHLTDRKLYFRTTNRSLLRHSMVASVRSDDGWSPRRWVNSSVIADDARQTGIPIRIRCSYFIGGVSGKTDQEIIVSYRRSGHGEVGGLKYAWTWTETGQPNNDDAPNTHSPSAQGVGGR